VKIQRAYKTELDPTIAQKIFFGKCCGTSKYIFNFYLGCKIDLYKFGKQKTSAAYFPRMWGCWDSRIALAENQLVFPTHVGMLVY
jgi:hypothetical protein